MRRALAGRGGAVAVAVALAVVLVVALAPSWERPESRFDEGIALAYGVRVLEGDVPHRDFVSFYGPGNPWLLAGAFAIGGVDQETERVLGAVYRLLIVVGIAGVATLAGRLTALVAGLIVIPLMLRLGLPAYAAFGALGFSLAALALLVVSRRAPPGPGGSRWAVAAGLFAGAAALARPEAAVPLAVAALPLAAGMPRRRLLAALAGLAPAVLAWAVHAAVVGPDRLARAFEDLRASGAGRRLPFDPFSTEAGTGEASRVLVLLVALALASGIASWWSRRREPSADAWRAGLALALLGLGLVPYALSRLDYVHVVIPFMPAAAACVVAAGVVWRERAWTPVAAAAIVGALALLVAPGAVRGPVRQHANVVLGRTPAPTGPEITVEGRGFRVSSDVASHIRVVVAAAERERRRGARSLFVGPRDLRRSNFNDAFLYYLLADLEPASYYMELNPWTANRPGSGLAHELSRADLLILNVGWDEWDEPNESSRLGPDAPNRVVLDRFCPVVRRGGYELLRRCG